MTIKAHKHQYEVYADKSRFRVICAGRRWGKSILAQLVILDWCLKSPGLYWIVSPTYRQGKQIHWRGLQQIIPQSWIAKKNEVELSITLNNGSIIELKGAENPDALRGVKLRGLVIDEIASIRNWEWLYSEVLRPTLTDYEAPALFISTPKGFNHFHDLYQDGQGGKEDYKSWTFTSYDNPYIPRTEIDKARQDEGEDVFNQEYLAEFTRFTGLVYKEFDINQHVEPFEHYKDSPGDYIFGLDFAVRGWTAATPCVIKSDGKIYILDNYKVANETAKEHEPKIVEMLETYASMSKYTGYADPAGWMKNQQKDDMVWSIADDYENLPIVRANNEVTAGINYVRQLFKQNRIVIHSRCTDLIDEITRYQWKDQPATQLGSHSEPEEVRKINDHLVDAMRYMLYSKPETPEDEEANRRLTFPAVFTLKIEQDEQGDKLEEIDIPDIYQESN